MSGTSFDGVDAAIIETDGKYFIKKVETSFIEYNKKEREIYHDSILKNYSKTYLLNASKNVMYPKLLDCIQNSSLLVRSFDH